MKIDFAVIFINIMPACKAKPSEWQDVFIKNVTAETLTFRRGVADKPRKVILYKEELLYFVEL